MSDPLALRFTQTVRASRDGPADALADTAGLAAWVAANAGDLGVDAATFTPSESLREEVVALRQAVRALFARAVAPGEPSSADAARLPRFTEALAAVNATAMAVPTAPRLDWPADSGPVATSEPAVAVSGSARLRAALASAAVEFLAGPDRERLRACPAPRCVIYFVKEHTRQEWCSVTCGNRARAARHYRQHRAG
ncbi:CGNR zinc finger domain-containing protein [Sphaerisporangium corydalis]|uniref:CGNR zinc finger domain-containing protein n=1 Tax=Sphaerisporangium corydalis TaxID=1441875 RepID=A0ABV9ELH3_9ACTN|nr:ABATE domain-containing protein [Sphaerisporangium corydalis]